METAAHLAKELTSIARKTLGIKDGELFVNDSKFKIGVDPSFANFYFDKKGLYQGWIDPIFHFGEEVHK